MSEEKLAFGTDVSRLLDIVANALYTNRDVFLRELISNAADACDKLRYESLQNPRLVNGRPDFRITIIKNLFKGYDAIWYTGYLGNFISGKDLKQSTIFEYNLSQRGNKS